MKKIALGAVFMLCTASAMAADNQYIEGAGNKSCNDLTKDEAVMMKDTDARQRSIATAQWYYGYLSAWNLQNQQRLKTRYGVFGSDEQRKDFFTGNWISDVCKSNPKVSLREVVDEYIRYMVKNHGK